MNGNVLYELAAWLAPHLPLALAAVSLLLASGGVALIIVRSPAHRQRIGELTLAAALGWLVLAAIPLPRWLPAADASAIEPNASRYEEGLVREFIADDSLPRGPTAESVTSEPQLGSIDRLSQPPLEAS